MTYRNLTRRDLLKYSLALAVSSGLNGCGREERSSSPYAPGTVNGRLPRVVKDISDVSEIVSEDRGSWVIDQDSNLDSKSERIGGKLARLGNGKISVYSSRMDAQAVMEKLREQNPGIKYGLTQIMDNNYERLRQTGTLSGLK